MSKVEAQVDVPGRIADAEALWYDTSRWEGFVDGFDAVEREDDDWPHEPGARVVWTTSAAGRGRVSERVVSYEARSHQESEVDDAQMRAVQHVTFAADGDRTRMTLSLDYTIKDASPMNWLTDRLFIRGRMREALQRTLTRFAAELSSS